MPLNDELFLEEDLIAHNKLHKSRSVLELIRESLYKEEDHGLQAVLYADLSILTNEFEKGFLMLFPVLYNIALGIEESANKDPIAVLS